jgi:hypothetical protein
MGASVSSSNLPSARVTLVERLLQATELGDHPDRFRDGILQPDTNTRFALLRESG